MKEGDIPNHPGLITPPMHPPRMEHPLLIVVSAPSGTGKTTLCNRLVAERSEIEFLTVARVRGDASGDAAEDVELSV